MRHGRFYEDFKPGEVIEHWPGRTVTTSDHRLFCLIGLFPAHEGPRVHVAYLYSLLLGLSMSDVSVNAIYHTESGIRELEPFYEGDTIRCKTEVLSAEAIPGKADRGMVVLETRGYTQKDVLFMSFQRRMAVRSKLARPAR